MLSFNFSVAPSSWMGEESQARCRSLSTRGMKKCSYSHTGKATRYGALKTENRKQLKNQAATPAQQDGFSHKVKKYLMRGTENWKPKTENCCLWNSVEFSQKVEAAAAAEI